MNWLVIAKIGLCIWSARSRGKESSLVPLQAYANSNILLKMRSQIRQHLHRCTEQKQMLQEGFYTAKPRLLTITDVSLKWMQPQNTTQLIN